MVGKAFLWKAAMDSALTADTGRLFQRGIIHGCRVYEGVGFQGERVRKKRYH